MEQHERKGLVIGCGPSSSGIELPVDLLQVGVNDCEQHPERCSLDALVLTDSPYRFFDPRDILDSVERFVTISRTWAVEVYLPDDRRFEDWRRVVDDPDPVRYWFLVDSVGPATVIDDRLHLPAGATSIYPAVCLAEFLGANQIGIIGMDITGHPKLEEKLEDIEWEFRRLTGAMARRGVSLWNLSPESAVQAIPRMALEEFIGECTTQA